MLDSTSTSTVLLLAAAATLLLSAMLYPSSLLKWLQRKRYQYEVTFSLYMLTPTEKFILNSILFLLLSLFIIAASLYLPEHIAFMANRMSYYFSGDAAHLTASVAGAKPEFATQAAEFLSNGEALRQGAVAAGREL
ncbi:hypothetical protein BU23DRAFT_559439 [Bimuria novae-zelandiae CBS 107.79]|uniref:Uncharacterized protein n=1 Tax=Bimuria novae-zelandiae CBS 107.79 TaxID=1447943 RepID=A0A6A5UR69_9PLEO|nr:hypothetical protein BU23DRAFT_559439 [Bimuria novae-zelandiae CBS 107.79]